MSRTTLAAVAFTLGLSAGLLLALRVRYDAESAGAIDLRLRSGQTYRVRAVVDGDTIVLENGLHLRYSGVNAPEAGRFVKSPAPFSEASTARNRELVEGKTVRVELARDPLDMHGRALGRVFVAADGEGTETDAGEQLVREGLARAAQFGTDSAGWERLSAAQEAAKASGAGLWSGRKDEGMGGSVYSSASGDVFHAPGCAQGQRIKTENRRNHGSAAEARSLGLRPCEFCQKTHE